MGTALASPNDLVRITGLLHFAQDVNRTAGLGFLLLRRLITVRFVWKLVGWVAAMMLALFVVVFVALASV
eukprot:COSAG06_NODE_8866_length_2046_cov_3.000514_2_plen_70_part_00